MNMREKLARALFAETISADWDDYHETIWDEYFAKADAVLDALREPTPDMIAAGEAKFGNYYAPDVAYNIWDAMLDAAKSDPT